VLSEEDPEFYLNMSTGELLKRQRDAGKWYDELGRRWNKTPHWDEEERSTISELRQRASNYQNAIQKELDRQKIAKVAARDAKPASLDAALSAWFASNQSESPTVINLSWTVDGRQYSARYYSDSQKLDVSLSVPPGTPNARQRGSRHFLPCNTPGQHQAAIRAAESSSGFRQS